jgi:hypothetical protein
MKSWWLKGCWMLPDMGLAAAAAGAVTVGVVAWWLLLRRVAV